MSLAGYDVVNETKTLDTNVATTQGRSIGAPSGKKILSGGYYDGSAYNRPALTVDYAYTVDGDTFVWGFRCNDATARVIECYIVVADE